MGLYHAGSRSRCNWRAAGGGWGNLAAWCRALALLVAPTSLCSNFRFYFKQFGLVASLPSCWVFIVRKIIGNICTDVLARQLIKGTFTQGALPAPSLSLPARGASLKAGNRKPLCLPGAPGSEVLGSRRP